MLEMTDEERNELDATKCFEWLTGVIRMCGDEPPSAKQWENIREMIETVQANKIRRRIMAEQADRDIEEKKREMARAYQDMMAQKLAGVPYPLGGSISGGYTATSVAPMPGTAVQADTNTSWLGRAVSKVAKF